jgi:hypothetical protein
LAALAVVFSVAVCLLGIIKSFDRQGRTRR